MSATAELRLDRATLAGLPRRRLGVPHGLKPAVWLVETDAGPFVVKDATEMGRLAWLGRWQLRRERRALAALADLPSAPKVLGVLAGDGLVMSCMPGRPLDRETFRRAPRELVERLRAVMRELHRRGVFHLDLHARGNILVDDGGSVSLVDFGAAWVPGVLARRLLGRALAAIDAQACLKYLARYSPEHLSADEARRVLRQRRLRRLWLFTPTSRTAADGARGRLDGS